MDWARRNIRALWFGLSLTATALSPQAPAWAAEPIETTAAQAILIDAHSGAVLFEKNADEVFPPASLALLMTAETVFQAIADGRVTEEQEFKVSEHAWRTGGAPARRTTMFAKLNSMVPVIDLLRGVIIQIANDGAIALAEGLSGSEQAFAREMTLRALEVGMTKSRFANPTGYDDPDNQTTARDLAILARHIIAKRPNYYALFSQPDFTWNNIYQRNKNPLLTLTDYTVDGLMIGGTDIDRLGMVASARRGNQRLILAFFGLSSKPEREKEARKLFVWGFESFESVVLFKDGETVGEARVFGGAKSYVPLIGEGPIRALLEKGVIKGYHGRVVYRGPVAAPVEKGQQIGHLEVTRDKKVVQSVPLFARESVGIGGFHGKATDALIEAIAGLWY